jgi:hypothetical protein
VIEMKNDIITKVREIRKIIDSIQDKLNYNTSNYLLTLRVSRLKKKIVEMEEELKYIENFIKVK